MPFSARQGFLTQPAVGADTIWYDITGSEWTGNASSFSQSGAPNQYNITVSEFGGNDFRYRGCALHPNGNIYYAPRSSSSGMLEFDPVNRTSSYITDGPLGSLSQSTANFHSCILTEQGNIMCIPFSYTKIIEYSPSTGVATEFGSFSGGAKWSGAVLGQNGNVYCVPQNYNGVLEIDTLNKTTTTHTYGISMSSNQKWWGGYRSPKDDRIYCAPLIYGSVLVIAPDGQSATTETYSQTFSTSTNAHYGACGDKFGNVVMIRGDTGLSKVINPDTNTAFTFSVTGATYGGVTGADGNVYTVPKGSSVERIDLSSGNSTPSVYSLGTLITNRMAATTALNGNIYIAPDVSYTTVFEIDVNADMTITNQSNLILSPYLRTSKI